MNMHRGSTSGFDAKSSCGTGVSRDNLTKRRAGNERSAACRARKGNHRQGAMLILIAIMMVGFMVAVAFSIGIAQMHLSRTELRTATDAASKAAAGRLAETLDLKKAIAEGQEIAAENIVAGKPLELSPSDFAFGHSDESKSGRFRFNEGDHPINSVQVDGRRTIGSRSGPVPLMFTNALGVKFFQPTCRAVATYIQRDVVLVVDRSGSMRGDKFEDLVDAIDVFVETLETTPVDEMVGLASYSEYATEDQALTEDLGKIIDRLERLPISGYTSISRGMDAGRHIMDDGRDDRYVERTMIVMTDGRHNRGPEPAKIASELAARGVTIHTITFGSNADLDRMKTVARIGGGRHFHADDGVELKNVYREIALTLSTMMTQ